MDPTAVIKAPSSDQTLPIYSQASPADETQEMPPGAAYPTEDDLKYTPKDYVIGALDVVDISVLDLFQEGLETVLRRQVTESGNIDLPLLPAPIKAEGLTQEQLRQAIIQAYNPDVLKNPTVSVTLMLQRQNTFSILGAVSRPGAYSMVKRDMRLMDALCGGRRTVANQHHHAVYLPAGARQADGVDHPALLGRKPGVAAALAGGSRRRKTQAQGARQFPGHSGQARRG